VVAAAKLLHWYSPPFKVKSKVNVKAEEVLVNLIDPAPVTAETPLYVGLNDGLVDGFKEVVLAVGVAVGFADGLDVGTLEGAAEIKAVGKRVGTAERAAEGRGVGTEEGFLVGMNVVGTVVGTILVIKLVPTVQVGLIESISADVVEENDDTVISPLNLNDDGQ